MSLKIRQAISLIVILYLSGNLISYIGLAKGRIWHRLYHARQVHMWSISDEMILACTYFVIIGVSLVILSIALSTVYSLNG